MASFTTLSDQSVEVTGFDVSVTPERNLYLNGIDVHIGDDGTRNIILNPKDTIFAKFQAADPTDWYGQPPQWLWDAINRLAAALARSGHKP